MKTFKKTSSLILLTFAFTGCFWEEETPKTNQEILTKVHEEILGESAESIRSYMDKIPKRVEQQGSFHLEVFTVPKVLSAIVGPSVEIKKAILDFVVKAKMDIQDLKNPKIEYGVAVNGECDVVMGEQNITCNTEFEGTGMLAEDKVFYQVKKGSVESSLLPIAFSYPPSKIDQWYGIELEPLLAKINESSAGEINLTLESLKAAMNGEQVREQMSSMADFLESELLVAVNPQGVPVMTPDGALYVIEVQLNKSQLALNLEKMIQALLPTYQNTSDLEAQIKEMVSKIKSSKWELQGKLFVGVEDYEQIKFEGTLKSETHGEATHLVLDQTESGKTLFKAYPENPGKEGAIEFVFEEPGDISIVFKNDVQSVGTVFTKKGDAVNLTLEDEKIMTGTFGKEKIALDFFDNSMKSSEAESSPKRAIAKLDLSKTEENWSGSFKFYDNSSEETKEISALMINKFWWESLNPKIWGYGDAVLDMDLVIDATKILNLNFNSEIKEEKPVIEAPENAEILDLTQLFSKDPEMLQMEPDIKNIEIKEGEPMDPEAQKKAIETQLKQVEWAISKEEAGSDEAKKLIVQRDMLEQWKEQLSQESAEAEDSGTTELSQ